MTTTLLTGLLRRWLTQDVARTNAAQAAVRLQHRRHQLDDVEAFLAAQHHQPVPQQGAERSTDTAYAVDTRLQPLPY